MTIRDQIDSEQLGRFDEVDVPLHVGEHVTLPPCVPEGWLTAIQEQHGRPCPRVEIEPENVEAIQLAEAILGGWPAPLWEPFWRTLLDGVSMDRRLRVLRRVARALATPEIAPHVPSAGGEAMAVLSAMLPAMAGAGR